MKRCFILFSAAVISIIGIQVNGLADVTTPKKRVVVIGGGWAGFLSLIHI